LNFVAAIVIAAAEVLAAGGRGAPWRAAMGLPEPSARLGAAIESMQQAVGVLDVADGEPTSDALLAAAAQDPPEEDPLDGLVRRVLLAMLEERRTRRAGSAPAYGTRAQPTYLPRNTGDASGSETPRPQIDHIGLAARHVIAGRDRPGESHGSAATA
jgi:hypothetical protein